MSSFNVTTLDTVAKSLGNAELGFVGYGGALVVNDGFGVAAVTMETGADLFVDGAIVAVYTAVDINTSGTVVISPSGSIVSTSLGAIEIAAPGGVKVVHNAGYVSGSQYGVGWTSTASNVMIQLNLLNSGTITGGNAVSALSYDGQSTIDNSGLIQGSITGIKLSGDGAYNFAVTNSGTISGQSAIVIGFNAIDLVNTGTITGRHVNGQSTALEFEDQQAFADFVRNAGTITGDVKLGGGDDVLEGEGGRIFGAVMGEGGADTLYGGDSRDVMSGGSGDDVVDFAGGNDVYLSGSEAFIGSDGNDDLDGGDGIDTYDARNTFTAVTIRLHEQRATGTGIGIDLVQNFENAFGGNGADSLGGDAGRNVLKGGGGGDSLNGLEGNDRLIGNAGIDILVGNTGRDVMTGGADADRFDFNNVSDSLTGDSNRDIITDFTQGADTIDLLTIDANTTLAGNQAFTFIGTGAFTSVAGQLRFANSAAAQYTTVEGDVNGDGKADFSIGLFGNIILVAGDFVL